MKLIGILSSVQELQGTLASRQVIVGTLSSFSGSGGYFDGPYEVTPAVYEQSLPTAHKMMRDDVTVFEIPYAEVSNVYGTTVTIAS